MNKFQETKETKKLEMENRALRRDLDWSTSLIRKSIAIISFAFVTFVYFYGSESYEFLDAVGKSIVLTLVFMPIYWIVSVGIYRFWTRRNR